MHMHMQSLTWPEGLLASHSCCCWHHTLPPPAHAHIHMQTQASQPTCWRPVNVPLCMMWRVVCAPRGRRACGAAGVAPLRLPPWAASPRACASSVTWHTRHPWPQRTGCAPTPTPTIMDCQPSGMPHFASAPPTISARPSSSSTGPPQNESTRPTRGVDCRVHGKTEGGRDGGWHEALSAHGRVLHTVKNTTTTGHVLHPSRTCIISASRDC